MTTTDTMDTQATVAQSIRMIEAGCEYVRITAPSIHEARNLAVIKKELRQRGYHTPIIADIHFTPNAAEEAARLVEKVRVNPGNYADKKKFSMIEYNDQSYDDELQRIRSRFLPLVKICKEYGTAMRIGTNHGSLSDRVMSRYGDTPLGMVESALEFLRICIDENYLNIVLSMKASNPQVMVQAYRLLISKMHDEFIANAVPNKQLKALFPLHLGVTEAGDGEDGRIKSAAGIGALLEDGIGDTIRVSLTEDPEFEIPVARTLANRYSHRKQHQPIPDLPSGKLPYSPFDYQKRESLPYGNIGHQQVPVVIADCSDMASLSPASLYPLGYHYSVPLDKWHIADQACDYIYTGNKHIPFPLPGTVSQIVNYEYWRQLSNADRSLPAFQLHHIEELRQCKSAVKFLFMTASQLIDDVSILKGLNNTVIILSADNDHAMPQLRRAFIQMQYDDLKLPVIIHGNYTTDDADTFRLYAATDAGALLLDGFGDGLMLSAPAISPSVITTTAFGILQASRTRISKTEYISCPSCGRTLFNLQETTAAIRSRTAHLKGIKIGIMGCIVNGPGEMADADYGYVGSGVGKITLYKGKEVVSRNINSEHAVEALIQLIKDNGQWMEPALQHQSLFEKP